MAILECGESGSTGQEVIEQINDNTENKLPLSGGTMTGDLIIGDGVSGRSLKIRAIGVADNPYISLLNQAGDTISNWHFDLISSETHLRHYVGGLPTAILALDDTNNASITASIPVNPNHLTRKDYVDGLIVSGTAISKWGSVQTVALNVSGMGIVDPFVVGEVWNNSGVLTVSQG